MKTDSILARVNAILDLHNEPSPTRTELEKLADDLAAQVRMECAASKGNANALRTVNAILKRVRRDGRREQLMYAWVDGKNRQCICDGFTAYRLHEHLPLEERPESAGPGVNLDAILRPRDEYSVELPLPSFGELKAHVALEHAKNGRKHTPLWDFGPGRPLVNAQLLQEMLAILPDAKLVCLPGSSGLISALYAISQRGDGLLLPVRDKDFAARATQAEELALATRTEALFAQARELTADQRSAKLRKLYREYRSNACENEAYALTLEGFASLAALAFHPAA